MFDIIRRIDYLRKLMDEIENPSKFFRRLHRTALNDDLENCPLAIKVLLKFTECLPEKILTTKSNSSFMRNPKVPNTNTILPAIEVMQSDEMIAKGGRGKIFRNREKNSGDRRTKCHLCDKRHNQLINLYFPYMSQSQGLIMTKDY